MKKVNLIRKSTDRRRQAFNNLRRRKIREHKIKEQEERKIKDKHDAYDRAMGVV